MMKWSTGLIAIKLNDKIQPIIFELTILSSHAMGNIINPAS